MSYVHVEREQRLMYEVKVYCDHLKSWYVSSPKLVFQVLQACISLYLKIIIPRNNFITTQYTVYVSCKLNENVLKGFSTKLHLEVNIYFSTIHI